MAETPPKVPATPADKAFGRGCLYIIAIPVILMAGCGIVASTMGGNEPADNQYEAIAQCETRVERLLKAPTTADFETDARGGPRDYVVSGTVDSENGFGAMLRSEFQCQVAVEESSVTTSVDYLR